VAINNAYAKGGLAVKIVDRTGSTGVPSVPVAVNPPVSLTKETNDAGCVVFDGLNSGAYFGEFSKIGYVDPNGTNIVRPTNGWNVTTGSIAISTYQYDLAGQINFAFDTKYLTNAGWDINSPPDNEVSVLHQNILGPPFHYSCGSQLGTLTVNGAIAQKFRGPVGQFGSSPSGYIKNYNYDDRLLYRSPPYFLDPVQSAWRTVSYIEESKATK
jgi:hypothetical protein